MADNPWEQVGATLGEARKRLHLSKRAAAAAAGFSEITWRQLESGWRQVAKEVFVPVSPKDDTLIAAARAVQVNPAELFGMLDRDYTEPVSTPAAESQTEDQRRLAALEGWAARFDQRQEEQSGLLDEILRRLPETNNRAGRAKT